MASSFQIIPRIRGGIPRDDCGGTSGVPRDERGGGKGIPGTPRANRGGGAKGATGDAIAGEKWRGVKQPLLMLMLLLIVNVHCCFITRVDGVKIIKRTGSPAVVNVLEYGAKGDGHSDDSSAIASAFSAACNMRGSSVLLLPSNLTFRSAKPILLTGPCTSSPLYIQIQGVLQFDAFSRSSSATKALLEIKKVNYIRVSGQGQMNGKGPDWWKQKQRPHLLQFTGCSNVKAKDITTIDPPRMHINFDHCTHVLALRITTTAPDKSPNTDSIHVSNSQDVQIDHCSLHSGDDCVSIVGSSSDVVVSNTKCTAGHGYSIGSLGYGGATVCMNNITVRDSSLQGTTNGVRMKSYQGGVGIVQNVLFSNIQMTDVYNPIILNQFYCDIKPCHEQKDAVAFNNIAFYGITATTLDNPKSGGIILNCSKAVPCSALQFRKINIASTNKQQTLTPFINNAFGKAAKKVVPSLKNLPAGPPSPAQQSAILKEAAVCKVVPVRSA